LIASPISFRPFIPPDIEGARDADGDNSN